MLDLFVSHLVDLVKEKAVDLVKEKAVDLLKDQYELRSGVPDKLNKIVDVLKRIKAVADAADGVDLEKHEPLKLWTGELKAAAEEARDVLDEFEYHCLKSVEEEVADDVVEPCKRRKTLFGYISSSSVYKSVKRFFGSTDQFESLSTTLSKLEELASKTGPFLQLVADRKATIDREHHKHDLCDGGIRETTSSVVEPNWIGRQGVLEEIINKLLEEEPVSDGGRIPVLPVVGHGGMGKTTLAQHLINDHKVKSHFNVTMWAYVSQVFHVPTLTRKILESAAPNKTCSHFESLETLQQKLKDALKSKRFLLVLDDLWYDQNKFTMEEEWNKFCSPLAEAGGKGSRILLTSRTPEVKKLSGALTTINLQGLEQDECWSIIQRCANLNDGYQHLVEIGKKIALKVQGSPLAAKAVGRILQNNLDESHWLKIQDKELLQFGENDVMPVLKLSYRHLPPHLRQCFSFCSLFPKGHQFNVNMLVRMWVAQGYILGRANGEETEEDIGRRYFDDLLSAGFFTRISGSYAGMHDLMNDLARFVSKDEFLSIEDTLQLQDGGDIPETVRHLSVRTEYLPILSKERYNLSNLHTLITFGYIYRDLHAVEDVLKKLRRVRVLEIGGYPEKELPDDIGRLVHLRYLDLSWLDKSHRSIFGLPESHRSIFGLPESPRPIFGLPESLWRLYHLQVLKITKESGPSECLAEKLNHLVKLRFLSFKPCMKLTWIKSLKSLQVLSPGLVVEEEGGGEIGDLKELNELQEKLVLENLHYVQSGAAAREANLRGKKRLQKLDLNWSKSILGQHSSSACNLEVAAVVLEGLRPPSRLEQLRILNYPGKVCPNWMSNLSLRNLQSLELVRMSRVRKLSQEGFPSLKSLKINGMEELEEWDGSGGFRYLEVLQIENCPKMRELPTPLPLLESLELVRMPKVIKLSQKGFPKLKSLKICTMKELEWEGSDGFCYLEVLHIENCPEMRELFTLARTLTKLSIVNCGSLVLLGGRLHCLWNLEELTLDKCERLVSDLGQGLADLIKLKRLIIVSCPYLIWPSTLQDLHGGLLPPSPKQDLHGGLLPPSPKQDPRRGLLPPSLEVLRLSHLRHETLSIFLPGLSNLSDLDVSSCQYLKSMASQEELAQLTSLLRLSISDCPSLENLPALPSIKRLSIKGVEIKKCLGGDGEGMARGPFFLAIERLEIDDPQMLINVPVLKSLTSVQVIIFNRSRLISFSPEVERWLLQNGSSLKTLIIHEARELQALPDLPKSLDYLNIWSSNAEFRKRYQRDIGPDWHKIQHIKDIYI